MTVQFGNKKVSRNGAPFVLAEIGVNHDGDMAKGRALVEAAAKAGADGVKFQLFRADLLLAQEAELVEYQKSAAENAHDLLQHLELDERDMADLIDLAHSHGLAALVTPFSAELVDAVVQMKADGIKLASPDLVNLPLVEKAARTLMPLVLSSGAADVNEIVRTFTWCGPHPRVLLHCVSSYPTPDECAALGAITALRENFPNELIGYSDHTQGTLTSALAVMAGVCFLEKHLTLDRAAKGPDHAASLEPDQFAEYVRNAHKAFVMRGLYQKKVLPIEEPVRRQTRQSIVAVKDLKEGHILSRDDLTVKRPGTGIPAAKYNSLLGKQLVRSVCAGAMLKKEDLEK